VTEQSSETAAAQAAEAQETCHPKGEQPANPYLVNGSGCDRYLGKHKTAGDAWQAAS
jgi:hypothetical protein